jgi:hypothetical protein
MNRYLKLVYICISLLLLSNVQAIHMKYYGKNMPNDTDVNASYFYPIPEKYLEGINTISFFQHANYVYGGYYFPHSIRIFGTNKADFLLFMHELAHNQQFLHNEPICDNCDSIDKYESQIYYDLPLGEIKWMMKT